MATRSRYEILVRTRVGPAVLARLRIALTPITIPRNTVHRLRVPADRDLPQLVRQLTERGVELLEVRRCSTWSDAAHRSPDAAHTGDDVRDEPLADVIAPFRPAAEPLSGARCAPVPAAEGRPLRSPFMRSG
jgi:hypothetical protein